MKSIYPSMLLLFSTLMMSSPSQAQEGNPIPDGPYLGQTPPGSTAEVFAPGIVTTKGWEDAGVFSPDMKEFYFIRQRPDNKKIESVTFKNRDNQWHETVIPGRTAQPFFAPDGKTIHLGNQYKERTKTGWSEIKSLGSPFEDFRIMVLTASSKGTYVFDEVGSHSGDGVIRYSRLVEGRREEPRPLSKEINTGKWNAHPLIAPDESYIMWDGERESGYGGNDLYISFRQKDGSWGEAINLGDKINTKADEGGPKITPDGKYLFFSRVVTPAIGDAYPDVDMLWVDAQIIETLRPKK